VYDDLLEPLRADPPAAAILCDVDGTLAPITDDPSAASVPEATRDLLRRLAGRYALVGCLTGRRALDARRIVGVEEIAYAGNHGFEMLRPGEDEVVPDPSVGGRQDAARRFLDALDGAGMSPAGLTAAGLSAAGLRREDKGVIQALHWRGAASEEEASTRAQEVADLAQAQGLVPRWGRKVLEIRPVAGIDKGSAATRTLRESGVRSALFGGDDATDLDAFNALKWMARSERLRSAVCVGVTSAEQPDGLEEASDLLVDGTQGFAEILEALL
jgi:HAD superfamily hydrolase (TIGR01484 family)